MKTNNWFIVALLFCLFGNRAMSQSYPGFISGNYAGASGIIHQPASIAENAYPWDFVLVGVNAFTDNDLAKLKRSRAFMNFSFADFEEDFNRDNTSKYAVVNIEITGPSIMVRLKESRAVGFTSRLRAYGNVDGLTGDLGTAIADGFNAGFSEEVYANQQFHARINSWQEYGITYAQTIQNTPSRKIKAGITAKLLVENGGGQLDFVAGSFRNSQNKIIELPEFSLEYGYSKQLQNVLDGGFSFFGGKKGFGMDIGVVYEFYEEKRGPTPSSTKLINDYNKQTYKKPTYKYKLGFSLLDIGRLKYTYGSYSGETNLVTSVNDELDVNIFYDAYDDPNALRDSLSNMVQLNEVTGTYTMGLPLAFQGNLDYRIREKIHVNTNVYASLRPIQWADYKVHDISNITVTPRWENNWLGFYVPFYLNLEGQFNMGLASHIGPLVIGVHDFLPFLTRKEVTSAGAYFMLKTFIPGKKKKEKSKVKCGPNGWERDKRRKK